MKILLGVDFSRDSKAALRFVSNIRFPPRSEVFLVHVTSGFDELQTLHAYELEEGLRTLREKILHRVSRNLRKLGENFIDPQLTVHTVVAEGNSGKEILSILKKQEIDLAVLGTRGVSGMQRFLLGSVSEWVLQEAPCPVLVVRGSARSLNQGMRVVLTTDGSSEAQAALELLNALTFPPGSQIILFHVVEPKDYKVVQDDYGIIDLGATGRKELASLSKDIQGRLDKARMAFLKQTKKHVQSRNVRVEKIPTGYAAEEIIRAAHRFRAHLIVMGSRGLTRVQKTFLGSVSSRVARHAPCSVLVVREVSKRKKVRL